MDKVQGAFSLPRHIALTPFNRLLSVCKSRCLFVCVRLEFSAIAANFAARRKTAGAVGEGLHPRQAASANRLRFTLHTRREKQILLLRVEELDDSETIQMLPQKPDDDVVFQFFHKAAALGCIHPAKMPVSSA